MRLLKCKFVLGTADDEDEKNQIGDWGGRDENGRS